MKPVKSITLGALGALLVLAVAAIIIPQYADYRDRAETIAMLVTLKPLQEKLEIQLIENTKIDEKINASLYSKSISNIKQLANGVLVVKGGELGQVFVLIPTKKNNRVTWQCIGGNNNAMPSSCKETQI